MHDQAEKLRQMVHEFSNQPQKPIHQQHQQAARHPCRFHVHSY